MRIYECILNKIKMNEKHFNKHFLNSNFFLVHLVVSIK